MEDIQEGSRRVKCVEEECFHEIFVIEPHEIEWYRTQGFPLPKRCPPCRERRRLKKEEEARS